MKPYRRRRRRQRWLQILLQFGFGRLRSMKLALPVMFAGVTVLSACTRVPVEIRIKGPRDAVESTKASPVFPTFEKKNDSLALRASAFDDRKRYMGSAKVKWDSSDRSIATVSQTGVVTILSSGDFTVTAKTTDLENNLEASTKMKSVIIGSIKKVEPIEEEGKSLEMPLGEMKMFKAEVLDDRGKVIPGAKISWDSSSYATTVSTTGEVEARAIGTTQISAETKTGEVVRWDISVTDWKKPKRRRRR